MLGSVNAEGTAPDPRVTTTHQQTAPAALPQPDTSSPDWKLLSDDLGIWITRSDRLGLQGRLYVRRGDAWWPVAVDGAADIRGFIPVR